MMQTVVIRRSGYPVRFETLTISQFQNLSFTSQPYISKGFLPTRRLFADFAVRYRALLVKIYTQVPKDKAVSYLKKLGKQVKKLYLFCKMYNLK